MSNANVAVAPAVADQKQSFISACKAYFGLKPDQKLSEFGDEIKALSHEDKMELAEGLRQAGVNCADPIPVAA